MSGQPHHRNNSARSPYHGGPRQGRIPSQSGMQSFPQRQGQQVQTLPQTPSSPPQGHRPIPTVNRDPNTPPTDLQRWVGEQLVPFLRWAYTVRDNQGRVRANYNYDPDVNNAIHLSETIDAFDRDERLAGELILRIANPNLGSSSMDWILGNRSLVEILLYRHYQRHGGLILPPRQDAVAAMQAHEDAVEATHQSDPALHPNFYPRINLPVWRQTTQGYGPEGQRDLGVVPSSPLSSPPRKNKGKGPSHGPMGGNPFGAPGDRRPPQGGGSGMGGGIST